MVAETAAGWVWPTRVESPVVVVSGALLCGRAITACGVAQRGRRTGVVVLAPVPGRRCGLDNPGAGQLSGTATPEAR
jgi:hypothetical protein